MSRYLITKKERKRGYVAMGISFIIFLIGYIVLEFISTEEDPKFGNTVYIFLGSTLICIGALGIVIVLKLFYDSDKKKKRDDIRRKKHKLTFLKTIKKNNNQEQ